MLGMEEIQYHNAVKYEALRNLISQGFSASELYDEIQDALTEAAELMQKQREREQAMREQAMQERSALAEKQERFYQRMQEAQSLAESLNLDVDRAIVGRETESGALVLDAEDIKNIQPNEKVFISTEGLGSGALTAHEKEASGKYVEVSNEAPTAHKSMEAAPSERSTVYFDMAQLSRNNQVLTSDFIHVLSQTAGSEMDVTINVSSLENQPYFIVQNEDGKTFDVITQGAGGSLSRAEGVGNIQLDGIAYSTTTITPEILQQNNGQVISQEAYAMMRQTQGEAGVLMALENTSNHSYQAEASFAVAEKPANAAEMPETSAPQEQTYTAQTTPDPQMQTPSEAPTIAQAEAVPPKQVPGSEAKEQTPPANPFAALLAGEEGAAIFAGLSGGKAQEVQKTDLGALASGLTVSTEKAQQNLQQDTERMA